MKLILILDLTVWYEFWFKGIIGSFFFENEQGEAVTVNGDRYQAMLKEFLYDFGKKKLTFQVKLILILAVM